MGFTDVKDKFEAVLWGPPPADKAERKLLRKIDAVVMSYVCLSYFTNYLDRANLANAYVSGMQEAVGFTGNDYTYAGSMFTAGYIVGQLPCAIALSSNRIPPRFFFPFCAGIWGVLTLGLAFVTNVQQVWAIRFLQGCFEASTFCGTHYVLGAWYKDSELGRRSAVFTSSAQLGTLFSGVMQGGIITNLDNKAGISGWQWLFVIDFIITIPIAIYGFLMFPDMPHTTKAFWMTEEEREMCVERAPAQNHITLTWASLKSSAKAVVSSWQFYLFPILFGVGSCAFEAVGNYSEFVLWIKWRHTTSGKYTASQVNYIPTTYTAAGILGTYVLTLLSDITNNRFIINPIMMCLMLIKCPMILKGGLSDGARMFAYIITGPGYAGQATNFAWATSLTRDNEVVRAVTIFNMNLIGNIWNLWYNIVCWPNTDSPNFRNGNIATLVTGAFSVGVAVAILYLGRRFPPKDIEPAHSAERQLERGDGFIEDGDEKDVHTIAIAHVAPVGAP